MLTNYIEQNTLRCEAGYRGGGIEVGLDRLLGNKKGYKITAYQNYLGGGMLGSICNSANFAFEDLTEKQQLKVIKLRQDLNKYFHALTNHEGDEWEETTFEQCQNRPESAY